MTEVAKRAIVAYMFYYKTLRVSYRLLQDMLLQPTPVAGALGIIPLYWHTFEREVRRLSEEGLLEPLHRGEKHVKGVFMVTETLLREFKLTPEVVRRPTRDVVLRTLGPSFLQVLEWKAGFQRPLARVVA